MWHKHHLHLLRKLEKKGWSEEDIAYAQKVMFESHEKKTGKHIFLDHLMLWGTFIIIIAANLVAVFSMTPLLVIFPNPGVYAVLLLTGLVFGLLFQIVLEDMQHLFRGHHHALMLILIPYIALVGAYIILTYASAQLPNLWLVNRKPIVMAFFYVIPFVLPYFISWFFKGKFQGPYRIRKTE